jgi:very-short-patch-repair endonuclease
LDSGTPTGRDPDSEFEVFVADALRSAGYEAVPQIGAGGYFIDLGVRHPSYPHGFLAGIECDGATYHSAKSAKDRDALRQGVLEDMGWTIYRVWSTDWFNDPRNETRKLVTFLDQLRSQKLKATDSTEQLPWEADQVQIEEDSEQEDYPSESQELFENGDDEDNQSDGFQGFTNEESLGTVNSVDSSSIQLPLEPNSPNSQTEESSSRAVEESRPPSSTDSFISVDRARQQLIRLREGSLQRRFRDSPRDQGLLRRSMLEALLNSKPTSKEQFQRDIPQSLRFNTDSQQIDEFLEHVLAIIQQINPH